MRPLLLLICLGKAFLRHAGNLVGLGVAGDLAVEIGEEAWKAWEKESNEAKRKAELQALVEMAGQEFRRQVEQVVKEIGVGAPQGMRESLSAYLSEIPCRLRQSLEDEKKKVADVRLDSSEDLVSLLSEGQEARNEGLGGPRVILTAVSGAGPRVVFGERTTCIIGKEENCNIRLPRDDDHRTISRHHCLLDINPPDVRLRDLGSRNGTFINGALIGKREKEESAAEGAKRDFAEHDLKHGDVFALGGKGRAVFRVEVIVPAECAFCGADIAETENKASEVRPGVYRCAACRNKETETWDEAMESAAARVCRKCGKDVADEMGELRQGEFICKACRKDPLNIVRNLLELAQSGRKDLTSIQGYKVLRELGKGGMGAVYLARHEKTGAEVALKIMLPQVALGKKAKNRFLNEINLTKAVTHRHVVRLRDSGCSEGTFFFTLEFCPGGGVDRLLKERGGTLPIDEAVGIIIQVLDGLEYAHNVEIDNVSLADGSTGRAIGLVHRDLKPQNIFLGSSRNGSVAKVGDLGLAKAFDLAGLSGLTCTGESAGTPHFMPRQQVLDFRYAKPEVDVWAAAASLYFMLTGEFPRDFPRQLANKAEVWTIVLQSDPVPIRQRAKGAKVPKKLAEVIDQALTEKPRIGFSTAKALKKAFEVAVT